MQKTIFFIIFQVLLLGVSTSKHSFDLSHDKHDGVHLHFEEFEGESTEFAESHDNNAHFHFSFILLSGNNHFFQPLLTDIWHSHRKDKFLSKTYSPPVPPPNTAS